MFGYIYYLVYGEDEIVPDKKTLRARNEMMKQIRKSKIKLKKRDELKPPKLIRSDPINIPIIKRRRNSNISGNRTSSGRQSYAESAR